MRKQIDCKILQQAVSGQYLRGMKLRKETFQGEKVDAMKLYVNMTSKLDRVILHVAMITLAVLKMRKRLLR